MLIEIEKIDQGVVVNVKPSRIDMAISRTFKEELSAQLKEKPAYFIINLKETEYVDSSALGTLVSIQREVKAYGGKVCLTNLSQSLETLMKLSKLDAMFKICSSVSEALKS